MKSGVIAHRVASAAVRSHEAKAWRTALKLHLTQGMRLVTLFGRPDPDGPDRGEVVVTAVLQSADGVLHLCRTRMPAGSGYHELTSEFPALHCFERELHEQTGMRIAGHPWLKPIRYEGKDQGAMVGYPFYRLEGKEVHEVAVGPIHAGVIEPGSFRFQCLGEQVHHLEIQLGYQHRGVEKQLLLRNPLRLAPLVETIAGDSSIAHAWAYCAAVEALADRELAVEVEFARAILLELERVAMHLAGLSGLSTDIGFLQGATTYGRLRTTAINTSMQLCGSRFGKTALRPGGVRVVTSPESLGSVRANVQLMQHDLALVNDLFLGARTVQHRLRGVGVLATATACALGVVGPSARASGVAIDARSGRSDGAYAELPLAMQVAQEGDCQARSSVRIRELDASLAWLAAALERCGPLRELSPSLVLAPATFVVTLIEGWRGEVVHCVETGPAGELLHYKVQDPSLRNWMGLAIAMRGNEISDFPICNKSFDLSYCGHDL